MSRTLAILGGGQLAQMLGAAAERLGVACRALDPDPDACAARTCELITGDYRDEQALARLLDGAEALTFEFENVPATSLEIAAARGVRVRPGPDALRVASDRLHEKAAFRDSGMDVPPYAPVASEAEAFEALRTLGAPLLLKARSGGYDGKGQAKIDRGEDVAEAWADLGGVPAIAERRVELMGEISQVACRSDSGDVVLYPLAANTHRDGILARTEAPASVDAELAATARSWTRALLERLDYVGVLALELFVTPAGLMANEFAPRVHNTGHWTIEGARASQFENHVRAVVGLPLEQPEPCSPSVMLNLIGTMPTIRPSAPGIRWHDYGKPARPGRKLGHVTATGGSLAEAQARIETLTVAE